MMTHYIKYGIQLTILTLIYILSARIGLYLEVQYGGVTPIWPPSGIALAVFISLGLKFWPMIAIGEFVIAQLLHQPVLAGIVGGSAQLMEAFVAVFLLRHMGIFRICSSARSVLWFGAVGVLAPPVVSATLGCTTLWALGYLTSQQFLSGWTTWWLGDALGILVLTPILSGIRRWPFKDRKTFFYWLFFTLLLILVCHAMISLADERSYSLFFLLIPFVVFSAVHFTIAGSGSTAILLTLVVYGMRPEDLAQGDFITAVRMAFVGSNAFTGYLITGFIERRNRRVALIHRQKTYLATLHEIALGLIARLELDRLMESIVIRASRLMTTEHGFFFSREESDTLVLRAGKGLYADKVGLRLNPGEGMVGKVWQSGEAMMINSYTEWGGRLDDPIWDSISAIIGIPLSSGSDTIGVLGLACSEKKRQFNSEDLSVLRRFGALAAVAWENARIYTELHEQLIGRQHAEKALASSEQTYREIFNSIRETLLVLDKDSGRIVEANAAALAMFDCTYDEITDCRFQDLSSGVPPHSASEAEQWMKKANGEDPQLFEWRFRKGAEGRFWGEVTLKRAVIRDTPRLLVAARNIEDRKKAEARLLQMFTAIEFTAEDVMITDVDGNIQYVNPAFERITGYAQKEVIGKTPRILKSGTQDRRFYEDLWHTILNGDVWTGRLENRCKDGCLILQEANIAPITNEFGSLAGFVSVKRDISEQEMLRNQLVQAQKMEAVGTLAGGIAHDFNNILAAIIGHTEIALTFELDDEHPASDNLKQVLNAGKRASELVRQILSFSRSVETAPKAVDVRPILKEVTQLLRASLPSYIHIETDLQAKNTSVSAGATHVHQIIMNLGINAAHAMENGGGVLSIVMEDRVVDGNPPAGLSHLKPGAYLEIRVSDTGCGMADDVLERIFEPYFTTKETGKGTGLGLSVVHGIVKGLEGAITVESQPEKGTTFRVCLPVVAPEKASRAEDNGPLPEGHEHILFVDDEPGIMEMGKELLEKLGYRVTAYADSLAALSRFNETPDAFDLMITDMTMPNMTGLELSRKIQAVSERMPIIICTGFSEQLSHEETTDAGVNAIVLKPLELKELAMLIRQVLDSEAPESSEGEG